jgi:hypothetical protein
MCSTHLRAVHSQKKMASIARASAPFPPGPGSTACRHSGDRLRLPWREWIKMAAAAAGSRDSAEDLAIMASATVIGSIAIEGRPECVGAARSFVAGALGDADPAAGDAGPWLGGHQSRRRARTPHRLGCRAWPR